MSDMSNKEIEIQIALGTLSPMRLFLKMLSMQNRGSGGWGDERNPKIETQDNGDIHVKVSSQVVFVFNAKEEFIGLFNCQQ